MKSECLRVKVTAIVAVSERFDDVRELYIGYKKGLSKIAQNFEFVYVLDGEFPQVFLDLRSLQAEGEPIKIIKLARWFGEATALTAGLEHSSGDVILTLPAYHQIEASEISKVLAGLNDHDMVIGRRYPRVDSGFNRLQTRLMYWMLKAMTGSTFQDLGCGVRAFQRRVTNEVHLYGDQHRFFPLLASRQGFRIKEVDLAQSPKDRFWRLYSLGVYLRRLLDLLMVFFLIKFTKKPLRFFGLIGVAIFAVGTLLVLYLIIDRLFFGAALADRPALLLSSLLVVLGVQIFALGLIGELIIFTHAKEVKEYTVDQIIN